MQTKTVYYAHFMGIYDSPQENRDIETLTNLGFTVLNPNQPGMSELWEKAQAHHNGDYDKAFDDLFGGMVRECDVFAFRGLPNTRIPKGVARELEVARESKKLIIELPCATLSRSMNGEETREYLRDMGQR